MPHNLSNTIKYCLKCGNNAETLISEDFDTSISKYGEILKPDEIVIRLAREGNISKAMKIFESTHPKEFLKSHKSIEKSLMDLYLKECVSTSDYDISEFSPPPILLDKLNAWQEAREEGKNRQTLVLLGETGLGKTKFVISWLKSLNIEPIIILNLFTISKQKINCEYICNFFLSERVSF